MQSSGDGTAAGERTSRHALRALLVLGGFVAIWWALMAGVAQADSAPHHLLDQVRSQVPTKHHEAPVRDALGRAHHDVRATTQQVRHEVSNTTRPVARTASTMVGSTPLAPVATKATQTIRTTLSTTVATTRALVAKSDESPVVTTIDETVRDAIVNPESSTGQGNSHSPRHSPKAIRTAPAEHTSSVLAQHSVAPDRAQASTPIDAPGNGPLRTPSLPGPCSSPSGSGTSSSSTPVGITESSFSVTPTVLRDHHMWRLARLPVGPAYQPGSSPD